MRFYAFLFLSFMILFVIFIKIKNKKEQVIQVTPRVEVKQHDPEFIEKIPVEEQEENKSEEETPKEEEIKKEAPKVVSTYEEAIENSKNSGSDIFIYFGSPSCYYCEQMKSTTLVEQQVVESLSKYTQLDINTSQDKSLATKFSIYGVPTYVILSSDQRIIKRSSGYKNAYDFLNWLGE